MNGMHTGAGSPVEGSRIVDRGLAAFYGVVALVALAGQTGAAVEWLGWGRLPALTAVATVEFGGIALSLYADHRRRLGERALSARTLSAAVAAGAVAVNWFGHDNHLQGGFFAGMSALGYAVWLLHSGARRRDRLRAAGVLPPVAPVYGPWMWLRQPGLTRRARALALADPSLGLYGSLSAARVVQRTERRQAAIAALLRRKLVEGRDQLAGEIAVTVYDLDAIAARLAASADYGQLAALLATELEPARLAAPIRTGGEPVATPDARCDSDGDDGASPRSATRDARRDSDGSDSASPRAATPARKARAEGSTVTATQVARLRATHPDAPASAIAAKLRPRVSVRTVQRHLRAIDAALGESHNGHRVPDLVDESAEGPG